MTQEFVTLPREVVERALDALDAGVKISPNSVLHDRLRAALDQPQNHVFDAGNMVTAGWKLVPVEPTRDMLINWIKADVVSNRTAPDLYRAMLAAAPKPPTTEQSSAVQSQVEQEPAVEHELKDVRCECCGYMTHHREHMGCIRAAHTKREPLTDEKITAATGAKPGTPTCGWLLLHSPAP